MKVTKPKDLEIELPTLGSEVAKFELLLDLQTKGLNTYKVSIDVELSKELRSKIAELYSEAGWREVVCRTPNDVPGTTELVLKR